MDEGFSGGPWVREVGFDLLCQRLLEVFPSTAPQAVVDENWGEYAEAQRAFDLHGSHWSCTAVFKNREMLFFVNDGAYLFILPRMISCCLRDDGLDADIYGSVLSGLEYRIAEFPTLFSPEQRAALIAPLQYLFGGTVLGFSPSDHDLKTMRRILAALRK